MSLAIVYSRAIHGVKSPLVTIEVHLSPGLPAFHIVGLPEKAVKESRDRVRSALLYNNFSIPIKRITVNLAPADLPKEGGRFDLPIAIGVLAAQGEIPVSSLENVEFGAELALTGQLRSIQGVLSMAIAAKSAKRSLIIPQLDAYQAGLIEGVDVYAAMHLNEVVAHLTEVKSIVRHRSLMPPVSVSSIGDIAEVKGQEQAKRALEIAAAGGHSVLMQGSPGAGKSMLAKRFSNILPPMTDAEAIETATIYSLSHHGFDQACWRQRPFRAPHHTASSVALVGGGAQVLPGEISLAHNGVLFLDELPEFPRSVLEALREPLENGNINISRAARQAQFPARFQLLAAMNPCPCGYLLDKTRDCRCTPDVISRYQAKVSGPLLDRIDLRLEIEHLSITQLMGTNTVSETSETVQARVMQARQLQLTRQGKINALLSTSQVEQAVLLTPTVQRFMALAIQQYRLSARGYYRILRVARTIADLADHTQVESKDLAESLVLRSK